MILGDTQKSKMDLIKKYFIIFFKTNKLYINHQTEKKKFLSFATRTAFNQNLKVLSFLF